MSSSLPKLHRALLSADTFTVQDTEDQHNRITNVTWDRALDFIYSSRGTYSLTNERTNTRSTYIYR